MLLLVVVAGCLASPSLPEGAGTPAAPAGHLVVTFRGNETLEAIDLVPPVRVVATGEIGPEPAIGVTPKGTIFTDAYEKTMRSRDGGATWDVAYDYARSPHVFASSDPYLYVDPRTGRVFVDHMELVTCTNLAWSDDEGATWTQRPEACGTPSVDFPKVIAARPGPQAPPLAGVAYPDVVLLCYNKGAFGPGAGAYSTTCAVSYDGGLTFPLERQAGLYAFAPGAGFLGDCAGGATFADAPDGTLLAVSCAGYGFARTRDSGLTWEQLAYPKDNATLGGSVPYAAFGRDGVLYLLTVGEDGRAYAHRSRDQGDSWDAAFPVSAPDVAPVSHPAIVAGDAGRLAVAYLGTRAGGADPQKVPDNATWSLFIATLDDAAAPVPTVRVVQATPDADPVQVGPICLGGASCRDARNLADFIGAAAGPDGIVHVVFADGCVKECVGAPSAKASRGMAHTVATLEGWRLTTGSGTP